MSAVLHARFLKCTDMHVKRFCIQNEEKKQCDLHKIHSIKIWGFCRGWSGIMRRSIWLNNGYQLVKKLICVTDYFISPSCKKHNWKGEKLTQNLYNNGKYVLYYRNSKLYLKCGIKLFKKILELKQSKLLKNIDWDKRQEAKNCLD